MQHQSFRLYLRLLSHVRPYWRQFAGAMLGLVVLAATQPMLAALFQPMLDGTFIDKDPRVAVLVPLALVGLFLVRGLASFAGSVGLQWVAGRVVYDLQSRMFDHSLRLPALYFDSSNLGRVISKFTYDVQQVTRAATDAVTVLVRDTLTVIGLIAWMLYLDPVLTAVALVILPLVVLIVKVVTRRIRAASRGLQSAMGNVTHVVEETISSYRLVKIHGAFAQENRRFRHQANWARRYQFKKRVAASGSVPLVQITMALGFAVIIYVASRQAHAGTLSVGQFVSFFGAMALLSTPLKNLTRVIEPLQLGLAAAESIFGLLDRPAEDDDGTTELARATGHVRYDAVRFAYPDQETCVVCDASFVVNPGETVALVGPSGSGKTTLVNLLPRLYTPTSGRILLDGCDIRDLTLESLRRQIAYVGQDVVLFDDTIRANLLYGLDRVPADAELWRVLEEANLAEFVAALPDGIETRIGGRGVRMSGGQRQRLGIARALARDAPLLILDEATSALDTESERRVQAALDRLRSRRTTLVVAHRLSTVESADRILVLDHGSIVQEGTHRELLGRRGLYRQLYEGQLANPREAPA